MASKRMTMKRRKVVKKGKSRRVRKSVRRSRRHGGVDLNPMNLFKKNEPPKPTPKFAVRDKVSLNKDWEWADKHGNDFYTFDYIVEEIQEQKNGTFLYKISSNSSNYSKYPGDGWFISEDKLKKAYI